LCLCIYKKERTSYKIFLEVSKKMKRLMKVPEFSTRWYDLAEFFSSHCYTVRILSTECLHRFAVVFLSLQCLLFLPSSFITFLASCLRLNNFGDYFV
jgi:hypothetical protein